MEYEVPVTKDKEGRVIVNFYGIDFDITDEFVDGKYHKVIFGDPIVFALKEAEVKDESVENSNTTEESEKHEEFGHSEEAIKYPPVEEHSTEATDNHAGTSEEIHTNEKIEEEPKEPVVDLIENTDASHSSDNSDNENTPVEEDVTEDPKETEHNPETQEGEN